MQKVELELGALKSGFKVPNLHWHIAFSYDNKYVAMSGRQEEEAAFVWELPHGKLLKRPLLFGTSFLRFVGATYQLMGDGARVWDVKAKELQDEFRPETGLKLFRDCYFDHCMDLSSDGSILLGAPLHNAAYEYEKIGRWDVADSRFVTRYSTPKVKYNQARVKFLPDNRYFAFAAKLSKLEQGVQADSGLHLSIWDTVSGQATFNTVLPSTERVLNFNFSMDGALLLVANRCYKLYPDKLEPISWYYDLPEPTILAAISPANQTMVENFVNVRVLNEHTMLSSPDSNSLRLTDLAGNSLFGLSDTTSEPFTNPTYKYENSFTGIEEEEHIRPRVMGASPDLTHFAFGGNQRLIVFDLDK